MISGSKWDVDYSFEKSFEMPLLKKLHGKKPTKNWGKENLPNNEFGKYQFYLLVVKK